MDEALRDQTVVVVGQGGGIAHAVTVLARGRLDELERANLLKSFDTKVIGPLI